MRENILGRRCGGRVTASKITDGLRLFTDSLTDLIEVCLLNFAVFAWDKAGEGTTTEAT